MSTLFWTPFSPIFFVSPYYLPRAPASPASQLHLCRVVLFPFGLDLGLLFLAVPGPWVQCTLSSQPHLHVWLPSLYDCRDFLAQLKVTTRYSPKVYLFRQSPCWLTSVLNFISLLGLSTLNQGNLLNLDIQFLLEDQRCGYTRPMVP